MYQCRGLTLSEASWPAIANELKIKPFAMNINLKLAAKREQAHGYVALVHWVQLHPQILRVIAFASALFCKITSKFSLLFEASC